ncbi:ribulose-phosphate 3-epimerase [Anaerostipes sp.]|uniref:ribulose-phosphate 3-epimerase n=1 Tax=Anaerostipes sp. TaxID=1872530 RepID=UPI0025C638E1|nr:ribulose-phosphate 3-epimerase [Anaerostipes sp.]MBS7008446.1 ribulose-phosphate 3-epimerase [Anaerostipes sp.]
MKKVVLNPPCVSASVSCMDLLHLREQILETEQSGISFFHYDMVDGQFNKCFILGDTLLEMIRPEMNLPIEAHLAAYHPECYIERFAKLGADYIAVHYEAMEHPLKTFDLIRKYGAEPILAFKCDTAPPDDFLSLAKEVPWILKLTVNPGFSGQTMQKNSLQHIKEMRQKLSDAGLSVSIQADGNVNPNTINTLFQSGADIFTGGTSGLFCPEHSIKENREILLSNISSETK